MPQIIFLALIVFNLGFTLAKHGEPKQGKENFWVSLISAGVWIAIAYSGGFFD